jgi:RNA recognition motif-containing protein
LVGNKLYVGGLSWNTDNDGLRQAFERFGAVEDVRVVTDRETGRSRGFGFVTFSSSEAAQAAISEMDGTSLDGRNIKVNEAEDRPRGDRRGGGGGYERGGYGGGSRW